MAVPVATRIRDGLREVVLEFRRQYLMRVWKMDIGKGTAISMSAKLDVNASRIRLIELRAHGNRGAFPDVHLPDSHQVLPAELEHDFAQPIAYPRGYRDRHRHSSR